MAASRIASRLPLMRTSLFVLLGLLCLSNLVQAQDSEDSEYQKPASITLAGNESSPVNNTLDKDNIPGAIEDTNKKTELSVQYSAKGSLQVVIDSIEPEGGPTTGNTRVTVRGGPFGDLELLYPHPKCKFGRNDMVVDATYISCSTAPLKMEDLEGKKTNRTAQCLECDNSPPNPSAEIVPLQISLTGDFMDTVDSEPYRYYLPTKVNAIKPRSGLKDGNTFVEVWGENFLNFDDNTRCNFGSVSVKAHYVDSGYMTCISPFSDVVEKQIPFSVSLNKQQNSKDDIDFWYYNNPQIAKLEPDYGPDSGGNSVMLSGSAYDPFREHPQIVNTNETFCRFENITWVPAVVKNSTKAYCAAPKNIHNVDFTYVEVTLNAQQFSDDNIPYFYYRPPKIYDVEPRDGPTSGGTKITIYASNLQYDKSPQCVFGYSRVHGEYVGDNKVECTAPQWPKPGTVDLSLSYEGDKFNSEPVLFTYYESPLVSGLDTTCGPVEGYTQIGIIGQNFVNMGFDKVKCVFNSTIWMNATIVNSERIECDSPTLPHDSISDWYFTSVTINNRDIAKSTQKFYYYPEPQIQDIQPNKGIIVGGTNSTIYGIGFGHRNICKLTVRYGGIAINPSYSNETQVQVFSPQVKVPDAVVVSISGNGQQFIDDLTMHYRDKENTFTYYQDMHIKAMHPQMGPTSGNTKIVVSGLGFSQFRFDNGTTSRQQLYVKFVDSTTGVLIGKEQKAFDQTDERLFCLTPSAVEGTKAILKISFNQQDWQSVIPSGMDYSFLYYNAPQLIHITPSYGPVKNPQQIKIDISGNNFACPDTECANLWVRFGEEPNAIYVQGTMLANGHVQCEVPAYTKPDVLTVEVTFNGQDYTNDHQTFGFFDPYILDIVPRLISPKGTTKLRLIGFGFVDAESSQLQTKYGTKKSGALTCGSSQCTQSATFINKNTIETSSFAQSQVKYMNGTVVNQDPITLEASVITNVFTENQLEVWYYKEPTFKSSNRTIVSNNIRAPLIIDTDFDWTVNSYSRMVAHANFTCKFTIDSQSIVVPARMEYLPAGEAYNSDTKPTHVLCYSPHWPGVSGLGKLEISVNGQDYYGDLPFTITESLDVFRVSPMSGPKSGKSRVKLIGSGFDTQTGDVFAKFGVSSTSIIHKSDVVQASWQQGSYFSSLYMTTNDFKSHKHIDTSLTEEQSVKEVYVQSPSAEAWSHTRGGSTFVSVGYSLIVEVEDGLQTQAVSQNKKTDTQTIKQSPSTPDDSGRRLQSDQETESSSSQNEISASNTTKTETVPTNSTVESITPTNSTVDSLTPSNSTVNATTSDTSSANKTESSTKSTDQIQTAIATDDKSLASVDDPTLKQNTTSSANKTSSTVTKKTTYHSQQFYSYSPVEFYFYQDPVVVKVEPKSGLTLGGTKVELSGAWFDEKINYGVLPFCKFGDKIVRAVFVSTVRIVCYTPPSEITEKAVPISVSLNGVDFVNTNTTFSYYEPLELYTMTPTSGTIAGGTEIIITGKRFSNITDPDEVKCRFTSVNNRNVFPVHIPAFYKNSTALRCASPPGFKANDQAKVELTFNGFEYASNNFTFSFYHIKDYFPKSGPAETCASDYILIRGSGFRSDKTINCNIQGKSLKPLDVQPDFIKCPMCWEGRSTSDIGSAVFNITIDGKMIKMAPFYFYKQVVLEDLTPHYGPAEGEGKILFYGSHFRDDFPQVDISCKVGESIGKAFLQDQGTINCTVEQMELVDEDQSLPATISLNGQSWTSTNQTYTPYGVISTIPSSGPYTGYTDVVFNGKGFNPDLPARCRWGIDGHSAIVDAEIFDYTKLVCRSPASFSLPVMASEQLSLPVGIAFQDEIYKPYTIDLHRYQFYTQPVLDSANPSQISVGKMAEIYVFADEGSEFWEPVPQDNSGLGNYGIMCRFESFGDSVGMYVNATTILCLTPSNNLKPQDVSSEQVQITVAMNGQDFGSSTSNAYITFVGTGSDLGIIRIILFCLFAGIIIVALLMLFTQCYTYFNQRPQDGPNTNQTVKLRQSDVHSETKNQSHYSKASGRGSVRFN